MPAKPQWHDRMAAGQQLALRLQRWHNDPLAIALGLPRGGVVVAAEVAKHLQIPLRSWAVRKLAHPSNPELALGAIGPGGIELWEEPYALLDGQWRQRVLERERQELARRQRLYGDPSLESLRHRHLLVIDDGVATGLTVRAALQSLRQAQPKQLVLAVPVIDRQIAQQLRSLVSELIALQEVDDLWAVGCWYERFDAVNDQRVLELLAQQSEAPMRR
ncbi:MAG: hypothetical protein RLZZ533_1712 [Cyanobacteriota bacterium]|jgi:putative phosphoribosyl transferase